MCATRNLTSTPPEHDSGTVGMPAACVWNALSSIAFRLQRSRDAAYGSDLRQRGARSDRQALVAGRCCKTGIQAEKGARTLGAADAFRSLCGPLK